MSLGRGWIGCIGRMKEQRVEHTYKVIEIAGSSRHGVDDAVNNAVARAAKTMHGLRWFEVTQIRGQLDADKVNHWQVQLKVGFTLDEPGA